jgi:hypothetical protein
MSTRLGVPPAAAIQETWETWSRDRESDAREIPQSVWTRPVFKAIAVASALFLAPSLL